MFDWFTTIPGILIICGVILLIIAIILFALGAKKDRKEKAAEQVSNNMEPIAENTIAPTEVVPTPEVPVVKVEEPTVTMNNLESVENNMPESTAEVKVETEEPKLVIEEPVAEPVETPVATMNAETTTNESIAPVETTNTIYGGETPVVDFSVSETPVTIYGGNDPLEATQKLAPVEDHHVPYGGEYTEAKVVEPVVEQPSFEPVQEVVTPMPNVELNEVSQPAVINLDSMVETNENIVVEPVVTDTTPIEEEKPVVVEEL